MNARGAGAVRTATAAATDKAPRTGFRAFAARDAVHSWQKPGFELVNRAPAAFDLRHPTRPWDAPAMYHTNRS